MRCTSCGQENAKGARFCNACGAELATAYANCSAEIPPTASFCQRCGAPVHAAESDAGAKAPAATALPAAFAAGRYYQVRNLIGEGGKNQVFLATDTTLNRDVAFALV